MRKRLVAGNWKMNLDLKSARELVTGTRAAFPATSVPADRVDVVVCPPFPYLFPIAKALDGSGFLLGAQNLFAEPNGAYTGEVSAEMVKDTGATYVILGHSERRHTIGHHEDDWMTNQKLHAALRVGLTPILCIGETLEQRQAKRTETVLTFQLRAGLTGVTESQARQVVIAYEPVWAIGTGQTASPQQAQEAHAHVRGELGRLVGAAGQGVRILYGGSVKSDNAPSLFSQPDVDGGLIGGASLKADSFAGIVRAAIAAAG